VSAEGQRQGLERRLWLRLAAVAAAGAGLVGAVVRGARGIARATPPPRPPERVSVLPECVRCTGCAAICPTGAIRVTPAGIAVTDKLCNSCGYCVALCPVGGVRVNRA
jgi:heterodisulfide reductase subunit A-like polyferredoxin